MKILQSSEYKQLVDYLPYVKENVDSWQLLNLRLVDQDTFSTIDEIAQLVMMLFQDNDGRLYLCNASELIAVVHIGTKSDAMGLTRKIERSLPENSCEVFVHPPDTEGLKKLEIRIGQHVRAHFDAVKKATDDATQQHMPASEPVLQESQHEQRILVADDDLYVRTLIKKGVGKGFTVYEVAEGNDVVASYDQYRPDVLFLDIHLPGKEGIEILNEIIKINPYAYVIMLSADSSVQNVQKTIKMGAKGFMAKPFTKEKLMEMIYKCPTVIR